MKFTQSPRRWRKLLMYINLSRARLENLEGHENVLLREPEVIKAHPILATGYYLGLGCLAFLALAMLLNALSVVSLGWVMNLSPTLIAGVAIGVCSGYVTGSMCCKLTSRTSQLESSLFPLKQIVQATEFFIVHWVVWSLAAALVNFALSKSSMLLDLFGYLYLNPVLTFVSLAISLSLALAMIVHHNEVIRRYADLGRR